MSSLRDPMHEALCRAYVYRGFNAGVAARTLRIPERQAADLLRDPELVERCHELSAELLKDEDISARRVLRELGRLGFADIRHALEDDGSLRPVHQMSPDAAAAIAGIETETKYITNKAKQVPVIDPLTGEQMVDLVSGEPMFEPLRIAVTLHKIKRYDKNPALQTLAKHFKLVGDEGDGVNALASALAGRLQAARRRTDPPEDLT